LDLPPVDLPRLTLGIGIDENGLAALAERFGEFRGKLMAGDHLNIMTSEFASNQAASVPAESVVAAQRISVADDQHLAHALVGAALLAAPTKLSTFQLIEQGPLRAKQLNVHGDLAGSMGGTTEARVVGAHDCRDSV